MTPRDGVTAAREILNKLCEMGCCDKEPYDTVCDDLQAKFLAEALKAAREEGYQEGINLNVTPMTNAARDAALEEAARVLEPMAGHNEEAITGDKNLARGYRHAISVICKLKRGAV